MKTSMILWMAVIVTALNESSRAEECSLTKLLGNIVHCEIKGIKTDNVSKTNTSSFPVGTKCLVEDGSTMAHIQCVDTTWKIIGIDGIPDPHQHGRQKRFLGFIVNLFKGIFGGRGGPPPDKTPPNMICIPPIIYATASRYSTYAVVSWSEPTAHDERDGQIQPYRYGRSPGEYFPEGNSEVTYVAKDRSGNSATCSIRVVVKVVRCNPLQNLSNAYFLCQPVFDFIYGCECTFYCHEGFELHGPENMRCGEKGQWSNAQPTCRPISCLVLPSLARAGAPRCTAGFSFGSMCSYECSSGFDMPPNVSRVLVCENTKTWRSYGKPECIDVEPPVFERCPNIVVLGTDTAMNSTTVTWHEPKVLDNSMKAYAYQIHGVPPGSRLTAGVYAIKYGAKDAVGNKVTTECSFKVIVRDIRCPRLYPTPFVHFRCPNGYRTGSMCNTTCDSGKMLLGTSHVECVRSPGGMYGLWNWRDDRQTICESTNKCVPLTPPIDGAVACDNWEGGQYCQVQCKNGTEIAASVRGNKLYVCDAEGEWSAKPPVFETCREVRDHTQQTLGIKASYYFDGDCTTNCTRQLIAQNFIAAIEASLFHLEACPSSKECNYGNVQIKCGASTRRKRTIKMSNWNMSVDIIVNLPPNMFSNATFLSKEEQFLNFLQIVKTYINNNETEFDSVSSHQLSDIGIHIHCPIGSVKSKKSLNCIDCPAGTYFTNVSDESTCQVCKKGTYQDKPAQMLCSLCPVGSTTRTPGARSEVECEDACLPGSFSNDGVGPCSPCELGYFQTSYGQTECSPCPVSKSTMKIGTTSMMDCEEFDIDFVPGEISEINLNLSENVTIADFTISFWLKTMLNNDSNEQRFMTIKLAANSTNVTWIWENLSKVTWRNSVTADVPFELTDTRWHQVVLYWNSSNITISVDNHLLPIDMYNVEDNTTITFDSITVSSNGTGGSLSQLNIWQGEHNVAYRRCFESNIGELLSWKKFEEAELIGSFFNFPSQCDDFDSCVSSPCLHGACEDSLPGFVCHCTKGFQGALCDVNVDDCETNICMNNATCLDHVLNYTCACPTNFKGTYCEVEIVNGQWSEWGYWSECSTTCGDSVRKRERLCNTPAPADGGTFCEGDRFDFKNCNNSDCPSCPIIMSPANGSVSCHNNTESINCTISCDEGFDFDIEPLTYYFCGPHTFHEWNFQSAENPERRLPACVEIKMPKKLEVLYTANYRNLYCVDMILAKLTTERIDKVVKTTLTDLSCFKKTTCLLEDFQVTNCDGNSRTERSLNTAGFRLLITSQPSADELGNKSGALQELQDALQEIQVTAFTSGFVINVRDEEFDLDINFTDISGKVVCGTGETRIQYFCVPCGKGAYLETDYCKPCPVGTYQQEEGQTDCIKCPIGKTTLGIRSSSITDCSVDVMFIIEENIGDKRLTVAEVIGVVIGCLAAITIFAIVVLVIKRRRFSAESKKSSGKKQPSTDLQNNAIYDLREYEKGNDGIDESDS